MRCKVHLRDAFRLADVQRSGLKRFKVLAFLAKRPGVLAG